MEKSDIEPIIAKIVPETGKYLLCRALNGLNDTLCHIEKGYRYAKLYDRKYYVDTSLSMFADNFKNYFIPPPDISFEVLEFQKDTAMDVYPNFLSLNDIYNYTKSDYGNSTHFNFDLSVKHKERVLVFSDNNDGNYGIYALARFKLLDTIGRRINSKIAGYGDYDAVHVRNVGYNTDYKKFFGEIQDKSKEKLVLCTDSYECQEYAKKFFGKKLIINSEIPDMKGKELMGSFIANISERYQINVMALTDLFVLACSKNLYMTTIIPNKMVKSTLSGNKISGYGILARALHARPAIINKLLGRGI